MNHNLTQTNQARTRPISLEPKDDADDNADRPPKNSLAPDIAQIIQDYDQQGIHRTGTEVDNASAAWLSDQIEALGVEAKQHSFAFQRVVPEACHIVINGDQVITGVPAYDCHYTHAEGVSGKVERLDDFEPDSNTPPQAKNTKCPRIGIALAPPSENTPEQQLVLAARKRDRYAAIIVVSPDNMPLTGAALVNAEHFSTPFGPPMIQVAHEHWTSLTQAESARATITVVATANRIESSAINVSATVAASAIKATSKAPIIVMTPRSGWWQCASERGGGLAAFLMIMARLKRSPLSRDVIFTANTGHELGHIGLDSFIKLNPTLPKQAHCWIHLGANFAANDGTVIVQYSDAKMAQLANSQLALSQLTPNLTVGQGHRPFGEARNVFDGGGRYLSLLGSNPLFHHPLDRWPTAVDVNKTQQWSNWIADCVVQLAQ